MNVIFLDIDGVLNSERLLEQQLHLHRTAVAETGPEHREACKCFDMEKNIDPEAVEHLNRLIARTQSKVVISSSWRRLIDAPEIERILKLCHFNGVIIGDTPDAMNDLRFDMAPEDRDRGHEIAMWLKDHPEVERFVILDDCCDMAHLRYRLVQTDADVGLTADDVELAINMMSWNGKL